MGRTVGQERSQLRTFGKRRGKDWIREAMEVWLRATLLVEQSILKGLLNIEKIYHKIGSDLRVLGSEMGKVTAEFGRNGKSTDGLTQKNKVLTDQIGKQREKVGLLKGAFADSADQYMANLIKKRKIGKFP